MSLLASVKASRAGGYLALKIDFGLTRPWSEGADSRVTQANAVQFIFTYHLAYV